MSSARHTLRLIFQPTVSSVRNQKKMSGNHSWLETPVPIPNTEVKQLVPMILGYSEKVGCCRAFSFSLIKGLGALRPGALVSFRERMARARLVERVLLLVLLGGPFSMDRRAAGQDASESLAARGFLFEELVRESRTYRYAVYVPRAYRAEKRWPAILFLHGMGESGVDGSSQCSVGLGPQLLRRPDDWPFVVIMPQKPGHFDEWEDHAEPVLAMLDATREQLSIDEDRIAISGLSQGGHGCWSIGALRPQAWSAVVSICGYLPSPRDRVEGGSFVRFWREREPVEKAFARTLTSWRTASDSEKGGPPFWLFHGVEDPVVPINQSRLLRGLLLEHGFQARLTEYTGVGHDSWRRAYAEAELPRWLLKQRR